MLSRRAERGLTPRSPAPIVEHRRHTGGSKQRRKRGEAHVRLGTGGVPRGAGGAGGRAGHEVRALTVSVLDEKSGEAVDLAASDVALTENGVARDIASFKPDARPLSVAVLRRLERRRRLRLPPEPGRRGGRPDRPPSRRDALRAVDDRRPPHQARRLHRRQGRGPAGAAAGGAPGRQHRARRAVRGLGRPEEARARGRPHGGGHPDAERARVQQPRPLPRGRRGRDERRALPLAAGRATAESDFETPHQPQLRARPARGRERRPLRGGAVADGARTARCASSRTCCAPATACPTPPFPISRSASSS